MAFWRREGKRVVVYTSRGGQQVRVSRKETKHLDGEPDHNVDTWVRHYALTHEGTRRRGPVEVLDEPATIDLVETFCVHLASRRKSKKTTSQHRHNLLTYCLPFFVSRHHLADPVHWPAKSVRLLEHLESLGLAPRTINVCNVSMRVFWTWLVEEGHAAGSLLLRNAVVGSRDTPLSFVVSPDDVLRHTYASPELRLLSLIGYFTSLRPQEVVALRPRDFRAGSRAAELEACRVMAAAGHFGRLAVEIHRQRVGNDFARPKAGSRGWVACFDERAAREIVAALRERDPDALLFPCRLDWYFRLWRRRGYPGLTLKDLRRSSIYWLGHYGKLDFTQMKNHARHSDPSTTALYVRRPGGESAGDFGDLDLDA